VSGRDPLDAWRRYLWGVLGDDDCAGALHVASVLLDSQDHRALEFGGVDILRDGAHQHIVPLERRTNSTGDCRLRNREANATRGALTDSG